ncbi:MAG: GntR family transcriptional regulator [Proteobacteria bacterium]|nr:GntR family transcriptional regulator [Pseudomonadota bacterium]
MDDQDKPIIAKPGQPLFEQVCERLRTAIVSGRFAPNTRLVERELAGWLQVSRTPIREALRKLQSEGLLVGFPHQGYFVRQPSFDEAKQAYEMRRVVESASCEAAAERASESDLGRIRQALDASRSALAADDCAALLLRNKEFHHAIVQASHNVFFERQWLAVWAFVDLLRGRWWGGTSRPRAGHDEHEALVTAIARRDPTLARRLGEEHVHLAWMNVAARFEASDQ